MKNQTVVRVYLNESHRLMICFQPVNNFSFIPNKFIQYKTDDEKRFHSDWIKSGDLIKADFTQRLEYVFDLEFRNFNVDISSAKHAYINENEASDVIKDLQAYKRLKKKYYDKLSEIGASEHCGDIEVILTIIFKLLNVVGATVDVKNIKKSYGNNSSDSIIELIAQIYRSETT